MKDLLLLSQWLSPAFPVGAFAYSHGLETAVRAGQVVDAARLEAWLEDVINKGSARSDAVLLTAAYRGDVGEVDLVARAFQPSSERLREAEQLGAAFARTVRDVWALDVGDALYPVAVGHAAGLRRLPLDDTVALYAQGFLANLVSAAVRLVPLGQTEGQAVLARLSVACGALAREASQFTLDDLENAAFLSDIAAMRHETLQPRSFQS